MQQLKTPKQQLHQLLMQQLNSAEVAAGELKKLNKHELCSPAALLPGACHVLLPANQAAMLTQCAEALVDGLSLLEPLALCATLLHTLRASKVN
jgi:hypothetical protein